MDKAQRDPVVDDIIAGAIQVHRELGTGLLESAYQACVDYELTSRGLFVQRQVPVAVTYRSVRLDCGYRLDLVVDHDIIVEVKSVERLLPVHSAQVITYLKLTGARRALLLNFGGLTLKEGLRSFLGRGKQVPQHESKG